MNRIDAPFEKRLYVLCMSSLVAFIAVTFSLASNADHIAPILRDTLALFVVAIPMWVLSLSRDMVFRQQNLFFLAGVLLFILAIRAALSVTTAPLQLHSCAAAGSKIYQLECLLFSSVQGQSSIRMILPHFFAFWICCFASLYGSRIKNLKLALTVIALTSVSLLLVSELLAQVESLREIYISLFGPREKGDYERFHGPFTNVGWTWPFMAPATAVFVWLAFGRHSRAFKVTGILGSFITLSICAANGQRGAVLLILVCFVAGIFWKLWQNHSKYVLPITTLGVIFLTILTWTFSHKLPVTTTEPRLELWKYGWELFFQKPFSGHGHGSWLELSKLKAASGEFTWTFESAHNLYIQMLVELGLFHAFLIGAFLVLVAKSLRKVLFEVLGDNLLFITLACSFLLITNVQEVDHIRAIYYIWALNIGLILGFSRETTQVALKTRYFSFVLIPFLVLSLGYRILFSHGLYAFEPLPNFVSWPTLERWTKESFELKTLGKNSNVSLVFPLRIDTENMENTVILGEKLKITKLHNKDMVFAVGDPGLGIHSNKIVIDQSQTIDSRKVSARLSYPPFAISAPILFSRGHMVGSGPEGLSLTCAQECLILFRPCRQSDETVYFKTNKISEWQFHASNFSPTKIIDLEQLTLENPDHKMEVQKSSDIYLLNSEKRFSFLKIENNGEPLVLSSFECKK